MSQQTIEAPALEVPAATPRATAASARWAQTRELLRRHPWVWGAGLLLLASFVIVLWARARPGYDPYGWLVWGKLTLHWNLDTNGAPSWKPLPYLFTVPYAVFGHYQLWLWMVTSLAISLSGPVFAWRIAFRLTGADPRRRYAAYIAGLFAAGFMFFLYDPLLPANYMHYFLSAESDTMVVALCLIAIDLHLSGRHQSAFWIWWLGSLARPEVWPFYGLAGLWVWRSHPAYRRWLYLSAFAVAFLWFGIPGITSKSLLSAGNVAENSAREIHGNKIIGTLTRFRQLLPPTIWALAVASVLLAAWRRQRTLLVLTAGVLFWLLIEIGFALHGFPAVPRYMFESGAVIAILAGVFLGRIVLELPALLSKLASRLRITGRPAALVGAWGTAVALLAIAGTLAGVAHKQYRLERRDLTHERARTVQIGRLATVVKLLGGTSHILGCGQPNIPIEYQSILAYYMEVKVGILYVSPSYLRTHPHPLVNIYPVNGGWRTFPSHVTAASAARCQGLRLKYKT